MLIYKFIYLLFFIKETKQFVKNFNSDTIYVGEESWKNKNWVIKNPVGYIFFA